MTLIDCFNTFQKVSKGLRLSANARSLFTAVLGEFNSAKYPETLSLSNCLLRDISGIKSESSFHSAKNALVNARLIHSKKSVYSLTPDEALSKMEQRFKTFAGSTCNQHQADVSDTWNPLGARSEDSNIITMPKNKVERDKEVEARTRKATATSMFKDNGWVSAKLQEAWFKYEGQQMNSATMQKMYPMEKTFGTEAVCKAVFEASARNKEAKLTYNFVEKILQSQMKGGTPNGSKHIGNAESWEQQSPDWLD